MTELLVATDPHGDPPEVHEERKWRGPQYKHRHKFPRAWRAWSAFVRWVFNVWPRNP